MYLKVNFDLNTSLDILQYKYFVLKCKLDDEFDEIYKMLCFSVS